MSNNSSTIVKILNGDKDCRSITPFVKDDNITEDNAGAYFDLAAQQQFKKPFDFDGYGIVMCAGGKKYLINAWINIHMIRSFGCDLPIQIWHLGQEELIGNTRQLFEPLGVEFIDARFLSNYLPHKRLNGWELKVFALKYTTYKYVMFLDADSMVLRNFTFLFDTQEFKDTNSIFWPDLVTHVKEDNKIWKLTNLSYRPVNEIEAGQICIDRDKCWNEICLTNWMNNYSHFYYKYIYGDKDTFTYSWNKLNTKYTMCPKAINQPVAFTHLWFDNKPIFQHFAGRNKYSIDNEKQNIQDIFNYEQHLSYYNELKQRWKI